MPDPIIDDPSPDPDPQPNPVNDNWYGELAGENEERAEMLGKFDSFDSFLDDYNSAKNRDWRAEIAGDDDKFKSTLERYTDPAAFGNAHRELNQKVRSGQLKPVLAEDADEEAVKEFRRANNIPLEADGYLSDLPEGVVVGEDDKELMTDFMGALHGANADPAVAHAAIGWYNQFQEQQQEAEAELDATQSQEATDQLREAWGKDYRANMNLVKATMTKYFGEDAAQQLTNGRYQDGRGFFNDVGVMRGLGELARMVNDIAPIITQDPAALKSVETEIAEIEGKMGTAEYRKDETMQARYRELVNIRLKHQEANAA